jgi:hypothetical protein
MAKLVIGTQLIYVPNNLEDPKVLLKRLTRTIETSGQAFSRITMFVFGGTILPAYAKNPISKGADIGTMGYMLIEHLDGDRVGIGSNPEKSCDITDGGGGKLNIYCPSHGFFFTNDDANIILNGSTYSGYYVIDSIVDIDNFKITETYTADESTVPMYSRFFCEVSLEVKDFVLFRVNSALSDLYVVGLGDSSIIEVITIED